MWEAMSGYKTQTGPGAAEPRLPDHPAATGGANSSQTQYADLHASSSLYTLSASSSVLAGGLAAGSLVLITIAPTTAAAQAWSLAVGAAVALTVLLSAAAVQRRR